MIIFSIDPGLTGACSVLDHNGLVAVFDLPVMKIPNVGPKALVQNKIDGRAFCTMLLRYSPASEGKPTFVIEAVGTMGGADNAVQTQGSLLRSLGALEAVAECLNFPIVYVNSQKWKRFFGLIDSDLKPAQRKKKALECARRLYPACSAIARAKDHNRAESILIGHWMTKELA